MTYAGFQSFVDADPLRRLELDRGYYWQWEPVPKKDGSPGLRMRERAYRRSNLYDCAMCGLRSGRHRVTYRSGAYMDGDDPRTLILCVGCWNKRRALITKLIRAAENKRLINKVIREIRNG